MSAPANQSDRAAAPSMAVVAFSVWAICLRALASPRSGPRSLGGTRPSRRRTWPFQRPMVKRAFTASTFSANISSVTNSRTIMRWTSDNS